MLKTVYKVDVLGKTQVFQWFFHFKNGEILIEYYNSSVCLSSAQINENLKKNDIILEKV